MRREQIQMIRKAIDPRMIAATIAELSTYHRVTASDQMNGAAEHAAELMRKQGVNAWTWAFPSSSKVKLGAIPFCDTWECRSGWCELVDEPGHHIADYLAMPLSVLMESCACDYSGRPLEIILMDRGTEESQYDGVDFSGKLLLITGQQGHYPNATAYTRWAFRRGALGYLQSLVASEEDIRGRWNQYDTVAWGRVSDRSKFGFGLSPREGDRLTRLYYEKQAKGEKLLVRCFIDAENSTELNTMSDAVGVIEGETDEEILLYGHLCHPRPSANDNLSGTSAVMEAARALNDLITRGWLPRPRRTIRAIVGPEIYGSHAWVEHLGPEGRAKIVAAINLDMVGSRQGHRGVGPVFLQDMPMCSPGISFDAASLCLEEIMKDTRYNAADWYCTHNMITAEYSCGSDHDVLNDPGVGVCCTYMGQWPDRFYHSTSDGPASVDPVLIARSSGVAASFAYLIATLTAEDIPEIMAKGLQNIMRNLAIHEIAPGEKNLGMAMRHYRDFYMACADGFVKLLPGDAKAAELAAAQKERVCQLVDCALSARAGKTLRAEDFDPYDRPVDARYQCVVKKNYIGRFISTKDLQDNVPEGCALVEEFNRSPWAERIADCATLMLLYCDGKRTFAQACTLVSLDRGEDPDEMLEPLYQYLLLLEKLQAVTLAGKAE